MTSNPHLYALIMAGGVGERFWPRSRKKTPKQLLDLTGSGLSMLALTVQRVQPLISIENIYVITNIHQKEAIHRAVPYLLENQVIGEPLGRNTAACVGLGAMLLQEKDPDSMMLVLSADHQIEDVKLFQETVKEGLEWAKKDHLVTIGITPTGAETEYGYIQAGEELSNTQMTTYVIQNFKEKPSQSLAQQFLEEGGYFWNTGLFIWKSSVILHEMQAYAPELYKGLSKICFESEATLRTSLESHYVDLPSLPIDIAVMEESERGVMVQGSFDWNDLGLWTSVAKSYPATDEDGNICAQGDYVTVDANDNFLYTDAGVVGILGVSDSILVREGDAVLLCHKNRAKDVKTLVKHLRQKYEETYL
jgi:mannose-1-phosphate guanylyltransferase